MKTKTTRHKTTRRTRTAKRDPLRDAVAELTARMTAVLHQVEHQRANEADARVAADRRADELLRALTPPMQLRVADVAFLPHELGMVTGFPGCDIVQVWHVEGAEPRMVATRMMRSCTVFVVNCRPYLVPKGSQIGDVLQALLRGSGLGLFP